MNLKQYVTQWYENRYALLLKQFYWQIHLTKACEYHCSHCYFLEISENDHPRISLPDANSILMKIRDASQQLGLIPRVDFTGGDPLLHPNFFELAEQAKIYNIPVGIKGNPDFLVKENVRGRLKQSGIRDISLSLDGLEPYQDAIRGKGSFDLTANAIGLLKEDGFSVRVQTTISKFNVGQILPILDFFIKNKFIIDNWIWVRYWSSTSAEDLISRDQIIGIFDELIGAYNDLFSKSDFFVRNKQGQLMPKVFVGFNENLWFPFLAEKGLIEKETIQKILAQKNSINCVATKHAYIVDPDGSLYKCRKLENSMVGNIIKDSWGQIQTSEIYSKFANLEMNSLCGSCTYFNGCGGCPALASAKRKSTWAGDPDCFIINMPSEAIGEFECPSNFV